MCNPILGTLLSAVGSLSSAARQSGIAKAQAQIARNNALVERRRAQLEADQKQRIRKRTISAARANALARGIDDDGSVALSIMEEIGQSEHDIAVNRFGREAQARRYEAEASIGRYRANGALLSGAVGAISPVINKLASTRLT